MTGLEYLFAAYAIIWLGLFGYLFSLSRRQRTLEKEVASLQRALDSRGPGTESV